jgi:hypothetical protein
MQTGLSLVHGWGGPVGGRIHGSHVLVEPSRFRSLLRPEPEEKAGKLIGTYDMMTCATKTSSLFFFSPNRLAFICFMLRKKKKVRFVSKHAVVSC